MGAGASTPSGLSEDTAKALEGLPEAAKTELAIKVGMQSAFVFVKPHANTDAVNSLVKGKFEAMGIKILKDGVIDGKTIDSEKHIDNHYYSIASKATLTEPKDLNIPVEKFKEFFEEDWSTVLEEGRAFTAVDLQKKLGCTSEELDAKWDATKEKKRVKFGGGFYCGQIEHEDKKLYTFNAFFMTMRSKFCAESASIHFYVVEFDPKALKWADFRGKVLGPTDPAAAPADSLRGTLHTDWEKLGLKAAPNTGDNGVHASASPFEGFAERTNWMKTPIAEDVFGKLALASGIDEATLKAWSVDPQVTLPDSDGKKGSLFDQVEDMDLETCMEKLKAIATASKA